ncbi:MAG: lipid A biosynthesis acyltransferase [Salinisphaeraceae bacterium]|nr:lipid A biosynthesis acyltransferase [Salinisphaeraceae bacterium]
MQSDPDLRHPRHWPSWILVGLARTLAHLPLPWLLQIGRTLSRLVYRLLPERRRIARVNLTYCFPELTPAERKRLLRRHFESVGMGAMETLFAWWRHDADMQDLGEIEGVEHLRNAAATGRGIILLSAHFTSLELGTRLARIKLAEEGVVTTAMYKPPHDPVIDRVMRRRRDHLIGESSIRYDRLKDFLRALKAGRAVWYAADQNAHNKFSAVLPFFGKPANTNLATSRLAAMSGAVVLPFFTLRKPGGGYRLVVHPPLEQFPSGDDAADALRINHLIEQTVLEYPEQYFWLHRRFRLSEQNDPYRAAARR